MACPLCKAKNGDELCIECDVTLLALETIHGMYSARNVADWAKSFVRELDFTFKRDFRVARYFDAAEEIAIGAIRSQSFVLPIGQIKQFKGRSPAETRDIMAILNKAGIAELIGSDIHLGDLGQTLASIVPSGANLMDESVRAPIEEMRGAICVCLAKAMLESYIAGDPYATRPRNFLLNVKRLSRHLSRFFQVDGPIPKDLSAGEFFGIKINGQAEDVVQTPKKQRERILTDILGISGGPPRLFESITYTPGVGFIFMWKDSIINAMERFRERYRERERERGR